MIRQCIMGIPKIAICVNHTDNPDAIPLRSGTKMRKIILAATLATALCACTSQQYAQFNQRVNDSISQTLGTRPEPPPPLEWKSETAIDYVPAPVPSAQERADAAYASHIAGMGSVPKVTFTPAPEPKQPSAQGIDLVDGAIVCRSYDLAEFMFEQTNQARHYRRSIPPELARQAMLISGYDDSREPKLAEYGCVLVPAGTPLSIEKGNFVPVVSGKLPNGRRFSGVTLPAMVGR
jgi:hypothetical protein